ncbi:MAG: YdcF family protein [Methyloprofundus sp.]|nr:YdcF family protein [Methyloprofundus sp.]
MPPEYAQAATLKTNSLARVRYGAFLAKKNQLPVLVSGGKVLAPRLPSEAEVMSEVLNNEFNQAVDWQEHRSRNTAENALYTREILAKENIQRIILVTHALHMQRAVDQFVQQGFKVLPAPTMFLSRSDELDLLSFIPSAQALQRNTLVIHEIMGRLWYKLRY